MKKAIIDWIDSSTIRGWQHADDKPVGYYEPTKIQSVGYLVEDTKDFVTLTTSLSENGGIIDPLSIPKVAIIKKRVLK